MRAGLMTRVLALLVSCVAMTLVAMAISSDERADAGAAGVIENASLSWNLADGLLSVPEIERLSGGQQAEQQVLASRANPEAVAERVRSRTAYERLGAAGAVRVDMSADPAVVSAAPSGLAGLPRGARLTRYFGANSARVTLPDGQRAVVDSTAPIAARNGRGYQAIDLSLRSRGGQYSPVKSNVPVQIPSALAAGAQLLGSGVSLTPLDGGGLPLQTRGTVNGASVFYPNTQRDSDTAIKATASGFEIYGLLRSVQSPERLSYRMGLPQGSRAVAVAGGVGGVRILAGDRTIAEVPAARAVDADGAFVPVSTAVSGQTLVVKVAHRSGDYHYPITVDPTVEDTSLTSYSPNWYYENTYGGGGGHFDRYDNHSAGWTISDDYAHMTSEWAALIYPTQGESHVYALSTELATSQATSNVETRIGIIGRAGWESNKEKPSWEASEVIPSSYSRGGKAVCVATGCSSSGGTRENVAALWLTALGTGTAGSDYFYNATVYVAQSNGPAVAADTTDEKLGVEKRYTNVLFGSGSWLGPNNSAAAEFHTSDPGIGVKEVAYTLSNGKKWASNPECAGVQCPETVNKLVYYNSSGPSALPDGEPTLEVEALNATGNSATTSVKLKVDGTAPTELALSGLPTGGEVSDASRALKIVVKAKDGSGTTVSSGIASLALAIDGVPVGSPSGNCSPGPCAATAEWNINAEEYAAGKHKFTVTATDNAGNVATSETPFTIHHAAPESLGPGSVNPVTGEYELEESDVSMPTSGSPLAITRAYNSREPTGGAEGPLGSPWSISFSGAQMIEETPTEAIVLTDTDGREIAFENTGGSHYQSPTGDRALVLTKSGSEFKLTDNGSTTTFAKVTGDRGNVWRPTVASGIDGTNQTVFTYQVVGGVLEPLEELAPVPVGVTCATEIKPGCRALTFNYATTTTATGEGPSEWGDYAGHLTRVYFTAFDPSKSEIATSTVAQYAYDSKGRLRAEWDPRISPALKTTYGYDAEGHLTSVSPPGREPWIFTYGTTSVDTATGRLVAIGRPTASTSLGSGSAPVGTTAPSLSSARPIVGAAISVKAGTWSNGPLRYAYQWERCNWEGSACAPIGGAINHEYTPQEGDRGDTLRVRITATNAGGADSTMTPVSATVAIASVGVPRPASEFGSAGTGNGQLQKPWGIARDSSGDVWVADTGNNRIEEFNAEGKFLRVAGTSGSGSLSKPEDVAVDSTSDAWVADTGNSRVVEFNPSGEYIRSFGTAGTGTGQFKSPRGIAIESAGDVWVADSQNNRVQEFTSTGTYLNSIGSVGSGNGQFSGPSGVALDSKRNVWVADVGNDRVQEFTSSGAFIRTFGRAGYGNGQFCSPSSLGIDPDSDNVWVTDSCSNRLEEFTSEGVFLQAYGTSGSGAGQFKAPDGITFSSGGYMYVLDRGNSRVQVFGDGDPQPLSSFGAVGAGEGQLSSPWGLAHDPSTGNIWVADTNNNRIEEFNAEGKYVRVAGTSGSGALTTPEDVAIDSSGNVWVADTGKSRIVEFNDLGEFVRTIGTAGSGAGQLKSPGGIAIDGAGHVWVADTNNSRVEEFTGEGAYIRTVGSEGSGNGQLMEPGGVAIDGKGDVWVADTVNARVEEFTGEGVYLRKFGSKGSGNGEFCNLEHLSVDVNERVWVDDTCGARVEVFTSTGVFIGKFGTSGTGLGRFRRPYAVAFSSSGDVYVVDRSNDEVQVWNGVSYSEGVTKMEGGETSLPSSATSTIEYGVPVSGGGAPYAMGSGEVAKWSQADVPIEATAIFAPDEQVGWPAPDYRRATIDYLDSVDRLVNVVAPGGGTSTTEYNSYNDVVRELTPDNRATALKEGAKSAEVSQTLDTQSTYGSEGTELLSTLGPMHTVKLASGSEAQAREHTVYSYDEGAPSGGPYRLVTKETKGAQVTGESEADVRTITTSYAGQNGLGWILRKPTATRTDPSGLKLTRTTVYDPNTGNVLETRTPGAGSPGEEILSGYIHKSAFGNFGSEAGQFSKPGAIAIDGEGNVWVADTGNNRVEEFSSGGTFVRQFGKVGTANGDLESPEGIAIDGEGNVWVADTGNNRIEEFSATGTFLFTVGTAGTGREQFKAPTGIAYSSTKGGRLFVADAGNSRVVEYELVSEMNFARMVAEFGTSGTGNGQFSKPEGLTADSAGDVWVADTGNNRIQVITAEGTSMHYDRQFGSLGSGNGQLSKPEGVVLDAEGNVLVADGGNSRVQSFTFAGVYSFQFGSTGTGELNFKTPAGLALNAQGEAYVIDTGNNRVEKWLPAALVHESSGTGGTHGTQTIYYTAGENTQVASCGWEPVWAGLPCQSRPAAQPETSGVPNLPVTTVTYNMWDEPLESTALVKSSWRTTTNTYDEAGRLLTQAVTSSVGTALPTAKDEYSGETGDLTKVSTTIEGTTRSVEAGFDRLGEMTSYKDADGNSATTTYDIDGRPETFNDGKGTQTYSYDSTTGLATQLVDSAAGSFTASYDVEGSLISVGYPNGMSANRTYDSTGNDTGLEYLKTTHCTSGCVWYSDNVVPSIHGQDLSQTSTLSSQSYTYDAAGRLTKTQDTPASEGCTTRVYAYDEETNITSLTTRAPGVGGACATEGGSVENHSYDSANRLIDEGISYDTFGDITKLPASDAGGSEVTSTYYADATLASQVQKGEMIGYYLDPVGRARLTVSSGNTSSTVTSHYAEPGSSPAWTEDTAGNWTRNISGIDGSLVAIQTNGAAPVLQIEDLHGDIVGTASLSETATSLLSSQGQTEYGVPRSGTPAKYSWLGSMRLATELPSGIIAMGARSYVPQIGRFLQPDPVQGGSANAYSYTYGDPVNTSDPSGEFTVGIPDWVHAFFTVEAEVATEAAIQRAAEEQAAREEAEEKAREAAEEAAEAAAEPAESADPYTPSGKKGKGRGKAAGKVVRLMFKEGGECDRQCKREIAHDKAEARRYHRVVERLKKLIIKAGTEETCGPACEVEMAASEALAEKEEKAWEHAAEEEPSE